jgi:hypothetical protein
MKRVKIAGANLCVRTLLITLVLAIVTVSCGGGKSNTQQKIAENSTGGQQDIEARVETQEISPQKEIQNEPTDWLSGDFKLMFEGKPIDVSGIMGGKNDNLTARYTIVRVKDKLYWNVVVVGEGEINSLFCMENGTLMYYALNPQTREAARRKANFETIEALLRWNLAESVYASTKGTDTIPKIGTEQVAGINCDVYKKETEMTNPQTEAAKGLEALAVMLGSDTSEIDKMKNQIGGIGGTTTFWIDPTRENFVARKHVYLNMNGKITDEVTHVVTFFSDRNVDASEIPNISDYSLQN